MKAEPDQSERARRLPVPLAEYAEHLLIGTALDAASALEIASGEREVPAELARVQQALRAGWRVEDEVA